MRSGLALDPRSKIEMDRENTTYLRQHDVVAMGNMTPAAYLQSCSELYGADPSLHAQVQAFVQQFFSNKKESDEDVECAYGLVQVEDRINSAVQDHEEESLSLAQNRETVSSGPPSNASERNDAYVPTALEGKQASSKKDPSLTSKTTSEDDKMQNLDQLTTKQVRNDDEEMQSKTSTYTKPIIVVKAPLDPQADVASSGAALPSNRSGTTACFDSFDGSQRISSTDMSSDGQVIDGPFGVNKISKCSGGQRRILAIAAALLTNPLVLLLDEVGWWI